MRIPICIPSYGEWVIQDRPACGWNFGGCQCGNATRISSALPQPLKTRSGFPKIRSGLLAAFGDDVVADLLTFHESTHTGAFDGADMYENVLRAIRRLDEHFSNGSIRVRTSMRPWSLPTVSTCSTSSDGAVSK